MYNERNIKIIMTKMKNIYIHKLSLTLSISVLVLSVIAVIAEILPEVEAKAIVIPALILAIILSFFEIRNKISHSKNNLG
jgi:hypothetical protein